MAMDWISLLQKAPDLSGPSPNALAQLQLNQLRIEQAKQEVASQNALRQFVGNESNYGQNGQLQPSANALAQLGKTSPNAALDLMKDLVSIKEHQTRNALSVGKVREEEEDRVRGASLPARTAYEKIMQETGGDKDRAKREATEILKNDLQPILPTLSQSMRQQITSAGMGFDYERNTRNLMASPKYRGMLAEEAREAREGYTLTEELGPDGNPRKIFVAPGKPALTEGGNPTTPTGRMPFKASEQPPLYDVTVSDGKGGTKTVLGRRSTEGGLKGGFVADETGENLSGVVGAKKIGAGSQATTEQAQATAEAIYEYRQPPLSSYAMKSGGGPAIMEELKKIGQERGKPYDAKKYGQAKVLMEGYSRTVPNSPGGNMLAVNTAVQHLEQLQTLSNALKNHDTRAINYVINYAQTQLGRPDVTNFDTAAQIVADETLKAVIGSGAVFDREKLGKQLSNTSSPEQIEGGINTIKSLMGGRVNSLRKQWTSTGLQEDDFDEKLTPEAKGALEHYLPKGAEASARSRDEPGVVRLGADAADNQRRMAGAPKGTVFRFPDGSTLRKPQ
jgi:hypothetical protein